LLRVILNFPGIPTGIFQGTFCWFRSGGIVSIGADTMRDHRVNFSKVWENKGRHSMLVPCKRVVILAKMNPLLSYEPNVKTFRVKYARDEEFKKVKMPQQV
jgi:hypothetical protein